MIEVIGFISGSLAVWGVLLNNRRRRICFLLWAVSNVMSLGIHVFCGPWSLALRDFIFLCLALEGWLLWGREGQ